MTPDDPMLMAYADGELDGEEAARVEAAVAADPALAEVVAAYRALRDRLGKAFAPVLDEPVPTHLLPSAELVPFRRRRGGWVVASGALAASLMLGLIVGHRPRPGGEAEFATGVLAQALEHQLAADPGSVRVAVSFRDQRNRLCRVFTSTARDGIACRSDLGWALIDTRPGGAGASTEYRQAGSADAALMARAQDMMKGPPLGRPAEERARARGWR